MNNGSIILTLAVASGGCSERWSTAVKNDQAADGRGPVAAAPVTSNTATTQDQPAGPGGNVASSVCRAGRDVGALIDRTRELADADGDGEVSREEARSTMNFALGGLFFRADENADGKVTPAEAKKVRDDLVAWQPTLSAALEEARKATGENPLEFAVSVLSVDGDKALTIDEARAKARSSLDRLFRVADGDSNGSISRDEAIAASLEALRLIGHQAFARADQNRDGHLSPDEFQGMATASARTVFDVADGNKDGKLSETEATEAVRSLTQRIGTMDPRSSG
jgi:Ca2+-binding EF-hand superfamily protein